MSLRIAVCVGLRVVAQVMMFAGIGEEKSSFVRGLKMWWVTMWVVLTVVYFVLYALGLGGDDVAWWLSMGYLG